MHKTIIIILLLFNTASAVSQNKLSHYKIAADKTINKHFDSSVIAKLTCSGFSIKPLNGRRWFSPYYETFKDDTINHSFVVFEYSFFSNSINSDFSFNIAVDSNNIVDDTALTYIPKCFLKDKACDLIKKDSAIKIAIADSIDYQKNIVAEFKNGYNRKNYYWIITGYPKEKSTKKGNTRAILSSQRRIINAANGKIVMEEG